MTADGLLNLLFNAGVVVSIAATMRSLGMRPCSRLASPRGPLRSPR